jgi:hypothetical protein
MNPVLACLLTVLSWIGAMVVATLLLFGIDVALHEILGGSPNLWVGLVFALVVYAALFKGISRLLRHPHGWFAAGLTSVAFIVGLPVLVTWRSHSDGPPIRSEARIPGRIDLVIVSPSARNERVPRPSVPPADLAAWDLQYTVAVPAQGRKGLEILVAGTDSRSTALRALRTGQALEPGSGRVQWRPGAQRAVVLDLDQAPVSVPGSGFGRLSAPGAPTGGPAGSSLVAATSSLRAPTYALLDAGNQQRLDEWAGWAGEHKGEADTLADLEGPTLLDASLRLVAQSRGAFADRQLAYAYRPLLFFDKRELYAWPVDVDAAFEEGDVKMCKHGLTGEECDELKRAADIEQSSDYLHFETQRFTAQDRTRSPQAVGSTYYYHVVHGKPDTYIDYWWYLPYNPSLSSWMCSPGFSVKDFDCFDHESDWEGITVEVADEGKLPPFVYYAQHSNVARFAWGELEDGWKKLPQQQLVDAHGAHHPLVFVARASHAAYRNPCSDPACFEYGSVLPEGKHNGEGEWSGDDDAVCAGLCLKPLPVTREGKPATWNAFSGPWGTQTCILDGTFCDRGEAPHSPSFQWRYQHPGVAHN